MTGDDDDIGWYRTVCIESSMVSLKRWWLKDGDDGGDDDAVMNDGNAYDDDDLIKVSCSLSRKPNKGVRLEREEGRKRLCKDLFKSFFLVCHAYL